MRPFRFDRAWRFDVSVDHLWEVLRTTEDFPRWFSWLDDFEAGPLAPGTVARFRVRPPLPYRLGFTVAIDEVVDRELVVASVTGDVAGAARLVVSPTADGGSEARLAWELELRRRSLVRIEPLARPAMLWGHDLVVAMGVRQFRRRALGA